MQRGLHCSVSAPSPFTETPIRPHPAPGIPNGSAGFQALAGMLAALLDGWSCWTGSASIKSTVSIGTTR